MATVEDVRFLFLSHSGSAPSDVVSGWEKWKMWKMYFAATPLFKELIQHLFPFFYLTGVHRAIVVSGYGQVATVEDVRFLFLPLFLAGVHRVTWLVAWEEWQP